MTETTDDAARRIIEQIRQAGQPFTPSDYLGFLYEIQELLQEEQDAAEHN